MAEIKPCKTNCKECKHCDIYVPESQSDAHKIYFAIECKKYGILADHFNELKENVAWERNNQFK